MELAKLKELVDKALEDGKLTQREMDEIMSAIMSDDVVSAEELALLDKIEAMMLNNEIELA